MSQERSESGGRERRASALGPFVRVAVIVVPLAVVLVLWEQGGPRAARRHLEDALGGRPEQGREALRAMGDAALLPLVEAMAEARGEKADRIRGVLLDMSANGPDAVPALIAALEDPAALVRGWSMRELARIEWPASEQARIEQAVLGATRDEAPYVQARAYHVVSRRFAPERAAPMLAAEYRDRDNPAGLRHKVATLLRVLGPSAAGSAGPIEEVLRDDPDPRWRFEAHEVLTLLGKDTGEAGRVAIVEGALYADDENAADRAGRELLRRKPVDAESLDALRAAGIGDDERAKGRARALLERLAAAKSGQ